MSLLQLECVIYPFLGSIPSLVGEIASISLSCSQNTQSICGCVGAAKRQLRPKESPLGPKISPVSEGKIRSSNSPPRQTTWNLPSRSESIRDQKIWRDMKGWHSISGRISELCKIRKSEREPKKGRPFTSFTHLVSIMQNFADTQKNVVWMQLSKDCYSESQGFADPKLFASSNL